MDAGQQDVRAGDHCPQEEAWWGHSWRGLPLFPALHCQRRRRCTCQNLCLTSLSSFWWDGGCQERRSVGRTGSGFFLGVFLWGAINSEKQMAMSSCYLLTRKHPFIYCWIFKIPLNTKLCFCCPLFLLVFRVVLKSCFLSLPFYF